MNSTSETKINTVINKVGKWLLTLSAVSFVLLFLELSWFNRPAYDDMTGIFYAKVNSLSQYVIWMYHNISGRWISWAYFYTVMSPATSFNDYHFCFFIYHCLTLLIFIYSVQLIIRIGISNLFGIKISFRFSIVNSILFLACFYFFTVQNIETWWYIGASFMYLQGIVFLLLGVALLLKEEKKIYHYLIVSFCFIYVSSSYELYAVITSFLFSIFIVHFIVKNKERISIVRENKYSLGVIVAFVSLVVAALFSVFSSSNIERRAYYKEFFVDTYKVDYLSVLKSTLLDRKYLVAFVLASVWLLIGIKLRSSAGVFYNKSRIINTFRFFAFAFISSVIIMLLFQILIMYGILIPPRGWAFSSLSWTFLICFSFLISGYHLPAFWQTLQNAIKLIIPVIVFGFLSFTMINQYKFASVYSKKYDAFINSLIDAKKKNYTGLFYMDKLPDPGMLMQLDMEDDSHNPQFLKDILGVNFEIKVNK